MVKQAVYERRHSARAKRVLSVQFKLARGQRNGAHNDWALSTTEDMSWGGLSFYTDRELSVGDCLYLQVIMSGMMDVYTGYAMVVRVERMTYGVCFLIAVKFSEKKEMPKPSRTGPSVKKSRVQKRV